MNNKIKIGAVNFYNTKPLIYGFESILDSNDYELIFDYPANLSKLFIDKKINIGLLPTEFLFRYPATQIIEPFCIASEQLVASVAIFSDVPIQQIETIYLDFRSNTSVNLVKILLKKYWKQTVQFKAAPMDFVNLIKGNTAAVVIGDAALTLYGKTKFMYDLGETWYHLTKLPFVYACWMKNMDIDPIFIEKFNQANQYGLDNLDLVLKDNQYPNFNLKKYYTENIQFKFDINKKKGLALFLKELSELN